MRHGAPPVEITVRPSRAWRAFVAALAVGAVLAVAGWVGLDDLRRASAAWWTGAAVGIAGCLALAASLWPRGTSRLAFDGTGWQWQAAPTGALQAVRPQVAVDLGRLLLLRLRSVDGRRSRWLALERSGADPIWHVMRCALHDDAHPVSPLGLSR